jgi:hypothetical protein
MSADRGKERAFDEGWGLTPKEKERLAADKAKQPPADKQIQPSTKKDPG